MPRITHNKRPTIEDVAQLAGLSIATVSRYMNGTAFVSEENAKKIQGAIEQLNYVPHAAAQVLARQSTKTIGLLIPLLSGDFFAPMVQGIETRSVEDGYSLLVHSTEFQTNSKGPFKRILAEHNTDGLIVFSSSLDDKELNRLDLIDFPVVLLYRSAPPGLKTPFVTVQNGKGVYDLMAHLIEVHGCRRIAHLRGIPDHEDSIDRERGYRESLEKYGIPYEPDLVETGWFSASGARTAVRNMLAKNVPFDAILASDDESASGAMMELREAGLRIPEDVAVVGFDDISLAEHLTPPLTTVHSPVQQAGFTAADLLIQLIKGQSVSFENLLATRLVIRNSCGCNAA
jgi:LacI family transcriptional regulator